MKPSVDKFHKCQLKYLYVLSPTRVWDFCSVSSKTAALPIFFNKSGKTSRNSNKMYDDATKHQHNHNISYKTSVKIEETVTELQDRLFALEMWRSIIFWRKWKKKRATRFFSLQRITLSFHFHINVIHLRSVKKKTEIANSTKRSRCLKMLLNPGCYDIWKYTQEPRWLIALTLFIFFAPRAFFQGWCHNNATREKERYRREKAKGIISISNGVAEGRKEKGEMESWTKKCRRFICIPPFFLSLTRKNNKKKKQLESPIPLQLVREHCNSYRSSG